MTTGNHVITTAAYLAGAPLAVSVPCEAFKQFTGEQLRAIEETGPHPSLTACGNHDLDRKGPPPGTSTAMYGFN